ncbi:HEAT repeat domain-containing protein [Patescibacteria group bacterium]
MRRLLVYIGLIGISLFTFMFVITSTWIGFEVEQDCAIAIDRYGGNSPQANESGRAGCTEALIAHLEDESNSYKSRNSAIWGLGQVGDEKALPTLEKYYTGNIPDREPINEVISQYELSKAINLCSGGFNITKLVRENVI